MKTLLAAAAALLLAATPALAHAHLASSDPADGATVATAPVILTLTFTEGLELAFSGVNVTGPTGGVATRPAHLDPGNAEMLVVPFDSALPAGAYTVDWHALSTDGHKTTGSYHFTVK